MNKPNALAEISGSALRYFLNGAKGVLKSLGILLWRSGSLWSIAYLLYTAALFLAGYNPFKGELQGVFIAGGTVTIMLNAAIALNNFTLNAGAAASIGYRHPVWESNAHRKRVYAAESSQFTRSAPLVKKLSRINREYLDYSSEKNNFNKNFNGRNSSRVGYISKKEASFSDYEKPPIRRNVSDNIQNKQTSGTRKSRNGYLKTDNNRTEKPKIYMSSLEEKLIYDYPDRFEVYSVEGEFKRLERTEYK